VKILLDTNVILDVWLGREPFWRESARLLGAVEQKVHQGILCPTTVTTLHFLGRKVLGDAKARLLVEQLLGICDVARVTHATFTDALGSRLRDFEDAVIEAAALGGEVDAIATRNTKDFRHSRVPVREPGRFR
jgi:predicted nucleic acid-binding protein